MSQYVMYVGTYTHGTSVGIHIYDMDVEKGRLKERTMVPINNASYITRAHHGPYLYSICDEGVASFRIQPDGNLEFINQQGIRGMRGCYLSVDAEDRFLFVAGYHDGKITVMKLEKDGSIGKICDGIFHQGLGSVAERNFRPHVQCVIPTPDNRYVCAVDLGVDHVKVYEFDEDGLLTLTDILRCELESAPRHMLFSQDGRFAYLISELKNNITVYGYKENHDSGEMLFHKVQRVSTLPENSNPRGCAASGMKFSRDGNYLYCSNAGNNSIGIFSVDKETGYLTTVCILPISGDYPKDLDVFPDNRHVIALNHESNSITIFKVDYEKKTLIMNGPPLYIETPNCGMVVNLAEIENG